MSTRTPARVLAASELVLSRHHRARSRDFRAEGGDDLGHAFERGRAVQVRQPDHYLLNSRLGQFTESADVVGDRACVDRRRIPGRVAPARAQAIDEFGDMPVAVSNKRGGQVGERDLTGVAAGFSQCVRRTAALCRAPTAARRRSLETMQSAGK